MNHPFSSKRSSQSDTFKFRRTLLATSVALICSGAAIAQEDAADEQAGEDLSEEVVVVRGLRQSIKTAQDIKKNADTFVDAISSQDIGALPDRSVSEALQRIPGVNISRFEAANDPNRFGVEGSGAIIRGLPNVRSEFNGRDAIDGGGAQISFQDISPELLGSVVVYKNQTADLIEGGIAGTVNLNTRLPFDSDGRVTSISVEGNYGDLRESFSPGISGVFSNRWSTSIGEIGFLINGATNELRVRSNATILDNFVNSIDPDPALGGPEDPNGAFVGNLAPTNVFLRVQDIDRERESYGGALQWESVDQKWLASAQFLQANADSISIEDFINSVPFRAQGFQAANDEGLLSFNDAGILDGVFIDDNLPFRGPPPTAAQIVQTGTLLNSQRRARVNRSEITDFGFNLKYNPSDVLRFNFDAQYVESERDIQDNALALGTYANLAINFDPETGEFTGAGDTPNVQFLAPNGEEAAGASFFTDPDNFFLRFILQDQRLDESESFALRGDVEYDISDEGFFKKIRGGLRYNNQESDLGDTLFLFSFLSERFAGIPADQPRLILASDPDVADLFAVTDRFDDFDRRGPANGGFGEGLLVFNGPILTTQAFDETIRNIVATEGNGFGLTLNSDRANNIPGTPFQPSNIAGFERDNFAAYVRADFGAFLSSDVEFTGNVGLRYVRTDRDTEILNNIGGGVVNALENAADTEPESQCNPNPGVDLPGICQLPNPGELAATLAGIAGSVEPISLDYDFYLPSLNLRLNFFEDHNIRFAASRALSRPTAQQLQETGALGILQDTGFNFIGQTPEGANINAFEGFSRLNSGNAELLPQTVLNIDLSYEWYFNDTGSITVGAFYKDISSPIVTVTLIDEFALSETESLDFQNTLPVNSADNAELSGLEFTYKQFYDFLPGFLSGFGTNFNYTFIDASGASAGGGDEPVPGTRPFAIDADVFSQVSEHNVNAVLLYEKYGFQGRVAWNWRSEFQLTPRNVISPFSAVRRSSTGQLDASLFYQINDVFRVGVQGVNLLDDITETTVSTSPLTRRQAPSGFFRNDRRYSFILRATF